MDCRNTCVNSDSATSSATADAPPALQGPVFFLWGTDWQDQPMINANKLYNAVPAHINASEKKILCRDNRKNDIKNMFAKMAAAASPVKTATAAAATVSSPAANAGLSQESVHSVTSTASGGSSFAELAEARKAASINAMFDSPTKNPRPTDAVSPLKRKHSAVSSPITAATTAPTVNSPAPPAASPAPSVVVTPTKATAIAPATAAAPSAASTGNSGSSGTLSANVSPAKKRPEIAQSPASTPVKSPASGKQSIMNFFTKK